MVSKMEESSFFNTTLLCIFLIAFTIFIMKRKSQRKISPGNAPPGPPRLPLIGNLHQLLCLLPHRRLFDLSKIYGPIMHLKLGRISALVISSPHLAEQLLKHHDIDFSERCRVSATDVIFYDRKDIAFAPYGEYWRQMRKISTVELFSLRRVESFRSIREEEVSECVRSISSKVGTRINASETVFSLSKSIYTRIVIGSKCENRGAFVPLIHQVVRVLGGFTLADAFPSLGFIHVVSGMKSRLVKLHQQVDQMLEDIINARKARIKQDHESVTNTNSSLLDVLLSLENNPDFPFTTDSIKAIILDMFTAGIDTTATTIEWTLSELMKHPRVMKKAQEEARTMYAEHGKLDETRFHELTYLKAIIKETLRLHPPAPLIPRQCRGECKINGYDINLKTEVLINAWTIGRDPEYWVEPEQFYPERFMDSEVDYKGFHFELIPFGSGRRICPGLALGTATVEFVLAQLLYHFNWELLDEIKSEDLDMMETFSLVVRRKNDLHLIPTTYHPIYN